MRGAYCRERSVDADAGAEPQRGFGVLDREVGLARPKPAHRALGPAAREARVERYGMIDQSRHGTDVLAEIGQSDGRIRARFPIIANELQSAASEVGTLQTVHGRMLAPAVEN